METNWEMITLNLLVVIIALGAGLLPSILLGLLCIRAKPTGLIMR